MHAEKLTRAYHLKSAGKSKYVKSRRFRKAHRKTNLRVST